MDVSAFKYQNCFSDPEKNSILHADNFGSNQKYTMLVLVVFNFL